MDQGRHRRGRALTQTSETAEHSALSRRTRLIAFVVGVAAFALRQPAGLSHPYLWAEDGRIFLSDALSDALPVAQPYAGQLFVAQRLLFAALRPMPLEWMPQAVFTLGVLTAVGSSAMVMMPRLAQRLRGGPRQIAAFALLVALPGTWEILGNIVNIHWWLAVGAALLLLAPPARTLRGQAAECVGLLVVALSGLTAVYLAPLAAVALWNRRDVGTVWRLAPLAVGAAAQLATLAQSDRAVGGLLEVDDLIKLVVVKVGGVLLVGNRHLAEFMPMGAHVAFSAAAGALMLACLWVSVRALGTQAVGLWVSGALCAALGVYAASDVKGWYAPIMAGRYFTALLAFTLVGLVTATGVRSQRVRLTAAACLTACSVGLVSDARPEPPLPLDPAAWQSFADCVESGDAMCRVDIAPAGWTMTVAP